MKLLKHTPYQIPSSLKRGLLGLALGSVIVASASAADAINAKKEALRERLLEVENVVPTGVPVLIPLTEFANLTYERSWMQRWDNEKRLRLRPPAKPVPSGGTVWSDAIDHSMREQNGIFIPKMDEILYLDRSIVVQSGSRIIVHPETELRMITDEVEFPLIRNHSIVSGQEGPVTLCEGADRNILIQGGIWGDSMNSGNGPQGFREGKFGRFLGSQGAILLSNVENITVRNVRIKDYAAFGIQIGNARNFLIDDVIVDNTKDGVHVEGPAEYGIIKNIHGPRAGDDAVALNAWDWRTSSVTFGSITDILVDGSDVDEGACAIRILPGVKIYPNGSEQECFVQRCIFSNIRNIHSFKLYDQPNIRDTKGDYSGDISTASDLYFENIHFMPLHIDEYYDKKKNGVFEICTNIDGLYIDHVEIDYEPGKPNAEYIMDIGPKTRIARIPFKASGTQEIFNPNANPVARNIVIRNVYARPEGSTGDYVRVNNVADLVTTSSINGGGKGKLHSPIITD